MEVFKAILDKKEKKAPEIHQKPFHFLKILALTLINLIIFNYPICKSQKEAHKNDEHYNENNTVCIFTNY